MVPTAIIELCPKLQQRMIDRQVVLKIYIDTYLCNNKDEKGRKLCLKLYILHNRCFLY